jgi:peptide deformylase
MQRGKKMDPDSEILDKLQDTLDNLPEDEENSPALPLYMWPAPFLKKPAAEVKEFGEELKNLAEAMHSTMMAHKGIGLAAPQVGEMIRLLTYNVGDQMGTMVNPEIMNTEGEIQSSEGCLSFPGLTVYRPRAESVEVRFFDLDGNEDIMVTDGLLAICLQHEIDHLNGKTFLETMSKLKRDMITRKFEKMHNKHKKQMKRLKKAGVIRL